VAPLIWSGAWNRHPSNVSGKGTVTALRSRSPVTSALRRCSPVVDLVPALPAEGPQQVGRDRAAPVALAAVHDLARPGGLDHELGCDHVLLSDATTATSQP
jgi:hypothetical protein